MKKSAPNFLRAALSCMFTLTLLLVQFPMISFANDFGRSQNSAGFVDSSAAPQAVFSNATSISITDRASGANSPNGISNPYPSNIAVSGLSGTVSSITVTLNGVTMARPINHDIVLVAPTGQNLMLMSDAGDLQSGVGISNVNLTFSDAAANSVPSANSAGIPTGTYKPTDIVSALANNDVFPSPAPSSITSPAPTGSATLASVFNGLSPNGNWSLYAIDDSLGGGTSTISGGWSIDITTAGGVAATTTTITSSLNPSSTTQSVTFTATVTSGGSAVTTGGVTFRNGATTLCTNVSVNASGQAVCLVNAGTLPEGTRVVTATYNGTASFGTSNGNINQIVNSPTVATGNQFCNNGGIALPDLGSANPYSSNVTVSNLTGTISQITVNLNNVALPRSQDVDVLLVSPNGQAFKIASDIGDSTTVSGVNLTLTDSAATALPSSTVLTSGTFRPTDDNVVGQPDSFPAPAPSTLSSPAPTGSATFASVFNGFEANGQWSLYLVDDSLGGGTGNVGNWCLNVSLNKFSTSTSVASSNNPQRQGQPITFTATVTASSPFAFAPGTPMNGTINFFDGATNIGNGTLDGSGKATLTTSALSIGMHSITAQYSGANVGVGNGGYAASTSTALSQSVISTTAAEVSINGRVLRSDGRPIMKAMVMLTDSAGNVRYAITNPFGYYRFLNVPAGGSYLISASAKNRQFESQFLNLNESMTNLDFIASPTQ